jgi:hypothetical protein
MLIKVAKNSKDTTEFHKGPKLTRRDFLAQTAITGVLSILGSQALLGHRAYGATVNCPPSSLIGGGFGQVFAHSGPAPFPIFASVITDSMNATMAKNYGVTGTSTLVQAGKNWMTNSDSPAGAVILAGPPGINAAMWKTILANTVVGANYGDFGQDDGNGENEGLVAGFAGINGKVSTNNKDMLFNTTNTQAPWAIGANASLRTPTPAALAATLTTTPAATGLTTTQDLTAASAAALAIETAFEAVTPLSTKKGGTDLLNSAICGFNNNPPTASPTYGTNFYTPSDITAITNLIPAAGLATMSTQNQAILAASFRSGTGGNGAAIFTNPNCDYHGTSVQNTANQDQINAAALVSMLAGFAAANQPGVILVNSNGSVSCSGTGTASITINGTATTVQSNVADGDNGGTFSQGLLLFYNPSGSLPTPAINGTINATNGSTKGASQSPANSMAGLMASALYYLNNGTIPNSFLTASGLTAAQLSKWMVVG